MSTFIVTTIDSTPIGTPVATFGNKEAALTYMRAAAGSGRKYRLIEVKTVAVEV